MSPTTDSSEHSLRAHCDDASILIVDDEPGAIQVLRAALSSYADVRFATSAEDAERLLRERLADLILLDAEMPGESGFDFCVRLKADPQLCEIPVIFVTSHDDVAFEVRALESGASDFIVKPVSAPRVQLRAHLHLRLKQQLEQVQTLAVTDSLTELANRRAFDEALEREWAGAVRGGRALSLVILDVDHFKRFNDALGHPAGDRCLQQVAAALRSVGRRRTDLAARIGGEEFALLLPDTSAEGARVVGDAACRAIRELAIPHADSPVGPHVTVSVGVCTHPGDGESEGPRALIDGADGALYLAKARGRARVESASIGGAPT